MAKSKKITITKQVKEEVEKIIIKFNNTELKDKSQKYFPEYRGKFLYLKVMEANNLISPVCRLSYTGNIEQWEFAIFKWSSEQYDPDEWLFPGAGLADGTVNGAMKAGYEAYFKNNPFS